MTASRLNLHAFVQGFKAIIPLWLGAVPLAIAYSVAAQKAGLTPGETQLASLTIFSAAVQLAAVQLLSAGASPVAIVATAVAMSLHNALYGLSLARRFRFGRLQRVAAAYFLTDSAYGVTIKDDRNLTFGFLFGAELSMFLVWNASTALGVVFGRYLVVPATAHLDFVGPLAFLTLLVLTARTRQDFAVVLISLVGALVCLWIQMGSLTVLVVGIGGAAIGMKLTEPRKPNAEEVAKSRSG